MKRTEWSKKNAIILADRTAHSMIGYWHDNIVFVCLTVRPIPVCL